MPLMEDGLDRMSVLKEYGLDKMMVLMLPIPLPRQSDAAADESAPIPHSLPSTAR